MANPVLDRQERRDARAVETTLAILSGLAIFAGLVGAGILVSVIAPWRGPVWSALGVVGLCTAAAVALAWMVRVLWRARRAGL